MAGRALGGNGVGDAGSDSLIRVSVVIPAFNAARTLDRAARSALAQTMRSVEVIIVDDGSDDDTFACALRLANEDDRVVPIRLTENVGPGRARNSAIDVARGEWIAVLDADDTYSVERLERLTSSAAEHGADVFADNLEVWWDDHPVGSEIGYDDLILSTLSPLTLTDFLEFSSPTRPDRSIGYVKPIFRKAFLDLHQLRYAEDIRCGEDWLFYAGALLRGARFCFTPDSYYRYTISSVSITQSRVRVVENVESLMTATARLEEDILAAGNDGTEAALTLLTKRRRSLSGIRRRQRMKRLILDRPALRSMVTTLKRSA